MMTFTLLLDLDDTLLDSNMDTFIPAYFQALSGALADKVAPEVMLPALMGGTKRMMVNTDPALTLREVFDAYFFPKLNARRADLQPAIEKFYDEVFPTLSHLTRPRRGAVDLVKWAIAHGHRLVIATNPLFPLKAVHHRLRWAGLFPEKYHFALVTSYENCHFTKENLAYFPEIMGQLGWPADPLVMAGNDPDMDLRPAQRAGFPVFWVKKIKEAPLEHPDLPQGTLEEFRPWLEGTDPKSLQPAFTAPEAMLALLRSTPAALATLTRDLRPDGYLCQPKPDEWCLSEILCHLRDVEREVSLPRIQKVLAEENPFIAGEDTDRWAGERRYADQDGRAALAEFTAARKETLSLLAGLASEWSHPARHAFFGPVTLQELMGFVAEHDRLHLQQVGKTI